MCPPDLFHTVVSLSTMKGIGLIILLYFVLVAFISVLFWVAQSEPGCDMGMDT